MVVSKNYCIECGYRYDLETAPLDTISVCLPCYKGVLKSEVKAHHDQIFKFSNIDVKKTRKDKKTDLPVGVKLSFQNNTHVYTAQYSSFSKSFSSRKYGEVEAKKLAIYVRRRMQSYDCPLKIEKFLKNFVRKGNHRVFKTQKYLPEGIQYFKKDSKNSERYGSCVVLEGTQYLVRFSTKQFGKKVALDLALSVLKKMKSIKSHLKMKKFINIDLPKIKNNFRKIKSSPDLPAGVTYNKDSNAYVSKVRFEGKNYYLSFSVNLYGLKAKEWAIMSREDMKYSSSLQELIEVREYYYKLKESLR